MEEEGEDGGRWGKWRKRITRVFTGGKEKEKEKGREGNKGSVEELPRIVVSSPEEVAVERRENDVMRGEEEVLKEVAKVGKEDMLAKAKEDQLAKAHQDVIAQMREAMLEARGGTKVGTGGERERWDAKRLEREAAAKAKEQQKPPVPPTKAVAVAKIREAIAEARREAESQVR